MESGVTDGVDGLGDNAFGLMADLLAKDLGGRYQGYPDRVKRSTW